MNCQNTREHLYSFIDNELDNQRREQVKEHLAGCPLCSLELEGEKKVDSLARAHIHTVRASYELKESILNRLETADEEHMRRFIPRRVKPVLIGIAAICIVLILFSSLKKPFPVFKEAAKEHIKFLQGNISIDIVSHKSSELYQLLQTKLDFKVEVPDLSLHGVELLGARICSLLDKKVAYIMYTKNDHAISMFIFDAERLKYPKAKKIMMNNRTFHLSKVKGFNSTLCVNEGIACVLVSDLDEAELLYLASI